jgi:hypothetical protein
VCRGKIKVVRIDSTYLIHFFGFGFGLWFWALVGIFGKDFQLSFTVKTLDAIIVFSLKGQ